MHRGRLVLATLAAAAVVGVGAVVALAAPAAVRNAASPSASSAGAVYCPPGEKERRKAQLKAFRRSATAARKAFFKTHPSKQARKAFLKAQQQREKELQRAVKQCD